MGEEDGLLFRVMERADLPRVIEILEAAEPEDAEEAVADIRADLRDRFVMTLQGEIFGLTGFRAVPDTLASFWVAWTGIDPDAVAPEVGEALGTWLIDTLEGRGGRKLFAMVADDDIAPGAGRHRGGAQLYYERLGFHPEVRHRNYYAPGEAATVLGRRLKAAVAPPRDLRDPGPLRIMDADEIPETDDAYYIDWQYAEGGPASTREDLETWLARIEKWEGRVAFVGLPGHSESAIRQLTDARFREEGRLRDLIEDGVDEVRMRFDF